MLKFVKNSQKFLASIAGAFAMAVGASFATSATTMWVQQPKCPKHLLK